MAMARRHRPHARIDDGEMGADGQFRQGIGQCEGAADHVEGVDLVADVEESRIGGDRQDHALADRDPWISGPEVGEQRDESAASADDAPTYTAECRRSRDPRGNAKIH